MTIQSHTIIFLSDSKAPKTEFKKAFQTRGFNAAFYDLETFSTKEISGHMPKAIIVQIQNECTDVSQKITQVKEAYAGLNLPVLALLQSTPPIKMAEFDSTLLHPYHPMQVVLRTIGLIRLAEMEQEIGLRLETLQQDFNTVPTLPKQNTQERFKILFVGKASPEFMIIINALQSENVNVVAAFTSFTAFDYLYEQEFDAVVMNGLRTNEPAFSVTQTMRKNAKLYHVPALFLTNGNTFSEYDEAYQVGINDIIDAQAELKEISSRILEQANFHRMHKNLKSDFGTIGGENCIDKTTQLFNQEFFNSHLTRISKVYNNLGIPISICLIRVHSKDGKLNDSNMDFASKQIGGIIKNLLRMQDITARLDRNLFAVAFPGQTVEQLTPVSERISSILKCATITDPNNGETLDLDLEINFSEIGHTENALATG